MKVKHWLLILLAVLFLSGCAPSALEELDELLQTTPEPLEPMALYENDELGFCISYYPGWDAQYDEADRYVSIATALYLPEQAELLVAQADVGAQDFFNNYENFLQGSDGPATLLDVQMTEVNGIPACRLAFSEQDAQTGETATTVLYAVGESAPFWLTYTYGDTYTAEQSYIDAAETMISTFAPMDAPTASTSTAFFLQPEETPDVADPHQDKTTGETILPL